MRLIFTSYIYIACLSSFITDNYHLTGSFQFRINVKRVPLVKIRHRINLLIFFRSVVLPDCLRKERDVKKWICQRKERKTIVIL